MGARLRRTGIPPTKPIVGAAVNGGFGAKTEAADADIELLFSVEIGNLITQQGTTAFGE